jgi:hypothetical protein
MTFSSRVAFAFLFWLPMILGTHFTFAQVSTIGREFYFGFLENNRVIPNRIDRASVIISASENAKGYIRYSGTTVPFDIKAGGQYVYDFPPNGFDIIHRTSGQVEDKGVYVLSDGNISVHAFNFRERSADGTVILPLSAIGKDYWVTAHHEEFAPGINPGSNVNYESVLLVVGTEDNTRVEIITTARTVNTIPPGAPIYITLDAGESYQIKATGDLTGSRVRVVGSPGEDCKNIAVFGGNKMTSVGRDCEGDTGDHLYQQIYPTETWGKDYIHIPFKGRTSGELVKVLASENNTVIFVDGQQRAVLNAGGFTTFLFGPEQVANITGSKPIAVTTFAKSQWCNIQSGADASNGDPTMVTLSPNLQLVRRAVFSAVKVVGIVKHYVNVIARSNAYQQTVLDGQNVGNLFKTVPGNPDFAYAQIEIKEGSHVLSNPVGVIGYVYGSGFIESYGYSAGASLNNLNFKTEVNYDFTVDGEKVACLNQEGSWKIIPRDPKFQIFEWTLPGEKDVKKGQSITHTFKESGTYEIKVLAFTGDRACDQLEEAIFEIEVLETKGFVEGPEEVCPEIDLATYKFIDLQHTDSVVWQVKGGIFQNQQNFSVQVQWGEYIPDAQLTAIPITKEGCPGDPIVLPILMRQNIVPGLPRGEEAVCFNGQFNSYEVKDLIPDREYEWYILGGKIISGQFTPKIEVIWDGPNSPGEVWYDSYSTTESTCGGESQHLRVTVLPELKVTVLPLSKQTCFGLSTGQIELDVSGGSGSYSFLWSHDIDLNQAKATDLPAGKYSVRVKDVRGCEIFLENLVISEADPIELASSPNVQDATCYVSQDGVISFDLTGGSGLFDIPGYSFQQTGKTLTIGGLGKGEYLLPVYDVLGCAIEIPFVIDAPEPLEAEFKIIRYPCSGLANGSMEVIPKGGIGPYQVKWSRDLSTSEVLKGISRGSYEVEIQDRNGCVLTEEGVLPEGNPLIRMPTGFRPDEGLFQGVGNCDITFKLFIYSRWGDLVYTGNAGWDGTINGKDAPIGTYSYLMEYTFILDNEVKTSQERGVFVLVR